MYPDYLIHYNKNHSKSNGQFVSGDGDGDGIANDHANQKRKNPLGYKATSAYRAGGKKLREGFYNAASGDVLGFVGRALSNSVSSYSDGAAMGIRYVSDAAQISLNVIGITKIIKGGKQMAGAARKYNSEH